MSQQSKNTTRTCEELLLEFERSKNQAFSSKLKFTLKEEKDVYNITAPFSVAGKTWIAGRVEARDSEYSRIGFFEEKDGEWVEEVQEQPICLQDPFVTRIGDTLVLGGVEVFDDTENPGQLNYRTVFYRGDGIHNLIRFAQGPDRMKDIRLCEMDDGKILVFTRPQGETGGRGKIGWCLLDGLGSMGAEVFKLAEIMEDQFIPEEWGGANELHRIADGKIGVLSHIAQFDDDGNRHYYSTVFCFDPETGTHGPMKMIARRKDFVPGPSKRPDLEDVIFSGGIIRLPGGKAELYCGVSDAEGQKLLIDDPFDEYEKK